MKMNEELNNLTKEQLIRKILSLNSRNAQIRHHYVETKAALFIIKKQLLRISENIVFNHNGNRHSSMVTYEK